MEPLAALKSSPVGTQHFEWHHITINIAGVAQGVAKMPCSKQLR